MPGQCLASGSLRLFQTIMSTTVAFPASRFEYFFSSDSSFMRKMRCLFYKVKLCTSMGFLFILPSCLQVVSQTFCSEFWWDDYITFFSECICRLNTDFALTCLCSLINQQQPPSVCALTCCLASIIIISHESRPRSHMMDMMTWSWQ